MALALGTNVGFVTTAPTADPNGTAVTSDGSSFVVKDTAPAGAVKIVEVGWYKASGTTSSNTQVGLYSDTAGVADARLQVTGDQASGTSAGWIVFTGLDWTITPGTAYWLGMQHDAHTGSSQIDSASSGGSGIDTRTSQTALTNPYGGGAVSDADGMYAIYAKYQTAPTTALNSPADSATGVSVTPTLNFTGTDGEADAVEYEVQVDTANTFDSQTPTISDSYSETNDDDIGRLGVDFGEVGQSFTATKGVLSSVKLDLQRAGSPGGNVIVSIYAHTGTYGDGVTGLPTGPSLAVSDNVSINSISTSQGLVTFSFSGDNKISLQSGKYYFLVLTESGNTSDASNYLAIWADTTFSTASGNMEIDGGGAAMDMGFYVYASVPPVDALSASDAGFSGTTSSIETDSYSESNSDSTASEYGGHSQEQGQSFKPNVTGFLTSCKFHLNKTGSPTGNATAILYAHTGTFGSTGVPIGSALATSGNLDVSTLTGTKALITFTFATPYAVTAGTAYCIVLKYTGGDASNKIGLGNDGSSPTHGGVLVYSDDGSTWFTDTPSDTCFYVYIRAFTSASATDYVVQSALTAATLYYWRVRAIDPTGSNTYGAWATTRSFTTTAGGGTVVKDMIGGIIPFAR